MANARQDIAALLDLINSSVNKLTATYDRANQTTPSLNGISPPSPNTSDLNDQADVAVLAAACDQLKATFVNPAQELLALSFAHLLPAALGVAIEARVAEGLREAPAEGVHVDVLARPSGFDPQILARCLRLLADHHVFREVSPDSFAHTRLSLPLDTGKSVEVIFKEDPEQLYTGTNGTVAALAFNCNQGICSSARLSDWVRSHHDRERPTETASPDESPSWVASTPFQLAYRTDETFWEWLGNRPDVQALCQAGLEGHASIRPSKGGELVHELPWTRLSESSVVVDVGGGNGSALLPIIEGYPHLRLVVQDLGEVKPQFNAFWGDPSPYHLQSGRVTFQTHNFFETNPVSDAAVYHLRRVLHDWPDPEAAKILSRIAEAAGPASYIVITDFIAPVASSASVPLGDRAPSEHAEIPDIAPLPAPLTTPTAQYGGVAHQYDLTMLTFFATAERTADHWRRLLGEVGLTIAHVVPGDVSGGSGPGTLVCVKR